ncbi:hypothetical protein [Mesoplasma coleopterae]|uniref:Uncharacterized protein n=1 Tax=Mesoplasma coleopterae TaxID=324078 RepID=A0A2K8P350_9MOLU|nr:hypothetical protein [Mesoplasma coleopterae]ATZ20928.1 hypothetical protein MCOLE_v1c04140 [Mesoplasma coleopterae]AVN62424.1 hypothetical protein CG001_02090 [Mesoplasma coleopterae]AVN63107.1 hypothetical protein CG000_02230 [Mesoplasma coleopterae]
MEVKQSIINHFENTRVKKDQTAKVFDINFTWEFTNLFEIISKPRFLKYLNMKYKKELTRKTVSNFNEVIDQIRIFNKEVEQTIWDYLIQTNNDKIIYNIYEEFLSFIYSSTKTFINDILIEQMIYWNEDIKIKMLNNKHYDTNLYFDYEIQKYKNSFQNFVFKKLKSVLKEEHSNSIIGIVVQAYEENLKENEMKLVSLKQTALLK